MQSKKNKKPVVKPRPRPTGIERPDLIIIN